LITNGATGATCFTPMRLYSGLCCSVRAEHRDGGRFAILPCVTSLADLNLEPVAVLDINDGCDNLASSATFPGVSALHVATASTTTCSWRRRRGSVEDDLWSSCPPSPP
jgi:hypothetical protein